MVGETTGRNVLLLKSLGWGRMWIARDRNIQVYPNEPWGFDNGAYRDYTAGRDFDADSFLSALERAMGAGIPRVAVTPDIVGGGLHSRDFSMEWRGRLPDEFPWYIAVQDGMTPDDIDLSRFAGVFLGGTNAYKATAGEWCRFAHSQGKMFHYGRCGTIGKLEHAYEVKADSVDSTSMMWHRKDWEKYIYHWLHKPQMKLDLQ